MDIANLIMFLTAALALIVTPGPDLLYVVSRSVAQGRAAGVASAFGIAFGIVAHTLAAALGLSALIMYSSVGFTVVKWAGAAYLVYLGVKMIRSAATQVAVASAAHKAWTRTFWEGATSNLLNPKVALFFLAFLPQFVSTDAGSPALQIMVLGTALNVLGLFVTVSVALVAGTVGSALRVSERARRIQQRITGGILIGLGGALAAADRA